MRFSTIISILVIAFSLIVWQHWGGFSNDIGTLVIAIADTFILTVIADNAPKKEKEKK